MYLWMVRSNRQIICRFWTMLAFFRLKDLFFCYILPLSKQVVLLSSTTPSVHNLWQLLKFLGGQETSSMFSAELFLYFELVFLIQCSWCNLYCWVWRLRHGFSGFWLLRSCCWQNVFSKMEALDLLRSVLFRLI